MFVSNADYVKVGDRVQLHPATDRWMMGDRFGVVIHLHERSQKVTVRLDRSGLNRSFSARNIGGVVYD